MNEVLSTSVYSTGDETCTRILRARIEQQANMERERIAKILHDQLGQYVTLLGISLAGARNCIVSGSRVDEEALACLSRAETLLEEASDKVRDVVGELQRGVSAEKRLVDDLQHYFASFSGSLPFHMRFDADRRELNLTPEMRVEIGGAIREAFINAIKHSRARHAAVLVRTRGPETTVIVADDGVGFDGTIPSLERLDRGWGLLHIRERLLSVGGTAALRTGPGRGTRWTFRFRGTE